MAERAVIFSRFQLIPPGDSRSLTHIFIGIPQCPVSYGCKLPAAAPIIADISHPFDVEVRWRISGSCDPFIGRIHVSEEVSSYSVVAGGFTLQFLAHFAVDGSEALQLIGWTPESAAAMAEKFGCSHERVDCALAELRDSPYVFANCPDLRVHVGVAIYAIIRDAFPEKERWQDMNEVMHSDKFVEAREMWNRLLDIDEDIDKSREIDAAAVLGNFLGERQYTQRKSYVLQRDLKDYQGGFQLVVRVPRGPRCFLAAPVVLMTYFLRWRDASAQPLDTTVFARRSLSGWSAGTLVRGLGGFSLEVLRTATGEKVSMLALEEMESLLRRAIAGQEEFTGALLSLLVPDEFMITRDQQPVTRFFDRPAKAPATCGIRHVVVALGARVEVGELVWLCQDSHPRRLLFEAKKQWLKSCGAQCHMIKLDFTGYPADMRTSAFFVAEGAVDGCDFPIPEGNECF